MPLTFETFQQNLCRVRNLVEESCVFGGREPGSVAILPVTKNHPAEVVQFVKNSGMNRVGENRVQEARDKIEAAAIPGLCWELIGTLQSNKANLAASLFDRVQSVDSEKLLKTLDRAAGRNERALRILLQVNAGRDPAKHGCDPEQALQLAELALACPHLRLDGLMTIAPLDDDPGVARRTFENLRAIRDTLSEKLATPLPELSMGMTDDMREAILAGSTMIRIGTAFFGHRL
jgi:pyridoxal phosphate enzyme (YggS family)